MPATRSRRSATESWSVVARSTMPLTTPARYLLLANDVPGVITRAVLRREGGEPGAVALVAQLSRKEVSGLLNFDKRGPKEAGPPEILAAGSTNSYTNFGE